MEDRQMKKGIAYFIPNTRQYQEMIAADYKYLCAFKNKEES